MNVTTECPNCRADLWAEPGPDRWDTHEIRCDCGSLISVGLKVTTHIVSLGEDPTEAEQGETDRG